MFAECLVNLGFQAHIVSVVDWVWELLTVLEGNLGKRENNKRVNTNIQPERFAGGHPPN